MNTNKPPRLDTATVRLQGRIAARYERRNAKRRRVHLANGDLRAACGAPSDRLTFATTPTAITCETCRDIAAKGGAL